MLIGERSKSAELIFLRNSILSFRYYNRDASKDLIVRLYQLEKLINSEIKCFFLSRTIDPNLQHRKIELETKYKKELFQHLHYAFTSFKEYNSGWLSPDFKALLDQIIGLKG